VLLEADLAAVRAAVFATLGILEPTPEGVLLASQTDDLDWMARDLFGLVSRTSEQDNLIEVRANTFGASFLMPEEGVRQFVAAMGKGMPSRVFTDVFDEVGSLDVEGRTPPGSQAVQLYDVVLLAHHFGVSRIAALYRLRNLRLVNRAEFDGLKEQDDADVGKKIARHLGLPEPDRATGSNIGFWGWLSKPTDGRKLSRQAHGAGVDARTRQG